MDINELRSTLSRFGIRPSKRLGQNFLLSEDVLDKIVNAAELTKEDTVLEIGPGLGTLTKRLSEKAKLVLAIEKDRKMCQALRKLMKRYENVKILCEDILFFDHSTFDIQHSKFKIVANIPYYITGKLLQNFLTSDTNTRMHANVTNDKDANSSKVNSRHSGEDSYHSSRFNMPRPSLMVLLLQKEVAERIVAKPGEMSILSISVQFYADPEIIDYVAKENFYPVPEVDSAIVRLKVLDKPRFAPSLTPSPLAGEGRERGIDEKKFFQLVKIGFSSKRKQLHNNLSLLPSPLTGEGRVRVDYKKILENINLNPQIRAQDLSLEDWQKLYHRLFESDLT